MEAKIYSHKLQIGTLKIEGWGGQGIISGEFVPNEIYVEQVQPIIWEREKNNVWQPIRFNAQLENGYFLKPNGGFDFGDAEWLAEECPGEKLTLFIVACHSHILADFFDSNPPRPFAEAPWRVLTIEEKVDLEDEVLKARGTDLTKVPYADYMKARSAAKLYGDFDFNALCRHSQTDEVLFTCEDRNLAYFAVINLAELENLEKDSYPPLTEYRDFDEFRALRMEPDKAKTTLGCNSSKTEFTSNRSEV
jgi:hypothetical protein